jgi:hypothetical protein
MAPASPDGLNSRTVRASIIATPAYPAFPASGRIDVRQGKDQVASAFFQMIGE